jgi:hypothetical protein
MISSNFGGMVMVEDGALLYRREREREKKVGWLLLSLDYIIVKSLAG